MNLTINGQRRELDVDPDMPLLWALRDILDLRGTKFGCGVGACGACMVHIDGEAAFSCLIPVGSVDPSTKITTIEGARTPEAQAVLAAWQALDVAQCGFCQPGQIMRASALLSEKPNPTADDITSAMNGNLCRCATYPRIKAGIERAAEMLSAGGTSK